MEERSFSSRYGSTAFAAHAHLSLPEVCLTRQERCQDHIQRLLDASGDKLGAAWEGRLPPRLTFLTSGGGWRAMESTVHYLDALRDHDVLAAVEHLGGLSGGSWAITLLCMTNQGRISYFHDERWRDRLDELAEVKHRLTAHDNMENVPPGLARMLDPDYVHCVVYRTGSGVVINKVNGKDVGFLPRLLFHTFMACTPFLLAHAFRRGDDPTILGTYTDLLGNQFFCPKEKWDKVMKEGYAFMAMRPEEYPMLSQFPCAEEYEPNQPVAHLAAVSRHRDFGDTDEDDDEFDDGDQEEEGDGHEWWAFDGTGEGGTLRAIRGDEDPTLLADIEVHIPKEERGGVVAGNRQLHAAAVMGLCGSAFRCPDELLDNQFSFARNIFEGLESSVIRKQTRQFLSRAPSMPGSPVARRAAQRMARGMTRTASSTSLFAGGSPMVLSRAASPTMRRSSLSVTPFTASAEHSMATFPAVPMGARSNRPSPLQPVVLGQAAHEPQPFTTPKLRRPRLPFPASGHDLSASGTPRKVVPPRGNGLVAPTIPADAAEMLASPVSHRVGHPAVGGAQTSTGSGSTSSPSPSTTLSTPQVDGLLRAQPHIPTDGRPPLPPALRLSSAAQSLAVTNSSATNGSGSPNASGNDSLATPDGVATRDAPGMLPKLPSPAALASAGSFRRCKNVFTARDENPSRRRRSFDPEMPDPCAATPPPMSLDGFDAAGANGAAAPMPLIDVGRESSTDMPRFVEDDDDEFDRPPVIPMPRGIGRPATLRPPSACDESLLTPPASKMFAVTPTPSEAKDRCLPAAVPMPGLVRNRAAKKGSLSSPLLPTAATVAARPPPALVPVLDDAPAPAQSNNSISSNPGLTDGEGSRKSIISFFDEPPPSHGGNGDDDEAEAPDEFNETSRMLTSPPDAGLRTTPQPSLEPNFDLTASCGSNSGRRGTAAFAPSAARGSLSAHGRSVSFDLDGGGGSNLPIFDRPRSHMLNDDDDNDASSESSESDAVELSPDASLEELPLVRARRATAVAHDDDEEASPPDVRSPESSARFVSFRPTHFGESASSEPSGAPSRRLSGASSTDFARVGAAFGSVDIVESAEESVTSASSARRRTMAAAPDVEMSPIGMDRRRQSSVFFAAAEERCSTKSSPWRRSSWSQSTTPLRRQHSTMSSSSQSQPPKEHCKLFDAGLVCNVPIPLVTQRTDEHLQCDVAIVIDSSVYGAADELEFLKGIHLGHYIPVAPPEDHKQFWTQPAQGKTTAESDRIRDTVRVYFPAQFSGHPIIIHAFGDTETTTKVIVRKKEELLKNRKDMYRRADLIRLALHFVLTLDSFEGRVCEEFTPDYLQCIIKRADTYTVAGDTLVSKFEHSLQDDFDAAVTALECEKKIIDTWARHEAEMADMHELLTEDYAILRECEIIARRAASAGKRTPPADTDDIMTVESYASLDTCSFTLTTGSPSAVGLLSTDASPRSFCPDRRSFCRAHRTAGPHSVSASTFATLKPPSAMTSAAMSPALGPTAPPQVPVNYHSSGDTSDELPPLPSPYGALQAEEAKASRALGITTETLHEIALGRVPVSTFHTAAKRLPELDTAVYRTFVSAEVMAAKVARSDSNDTSAESSDRPSKRLYDDLLDHVVAVRQRIAKEHAAVAFDFPMIRQDSASPHSSASPMSMDLDMPHHARYSGTRLADTSFPSISSAVDTHHLGESHTVAVERTGRGLLFADPQDLTHPVAHPVEGVPVPEQQTAGDRWPEIAAGLSGRVAHHHQHHHLHRRGQHQTSASLHRRHRHVVATFDDELSDSGLLESTHGDTGSVAAQADTGNDSSDDHTTSHEDLHHAGGDDGQHCTPIDAHVVPTAETQEESAEDDAYAEAVLALMWIKFKSQHTEDGENRAATVLHVVDHFGHPLHHHAGLCE